MCQAFLHADFLLGCAMFYKSFIVACFVLCAFSFSARADVTVGDPAPLLVAKALDGSAVDLAKLKGRTVIVYLWQTQCKSCVADLKSLRDFYNVNEDKGLAVVALSADPPQLQYVAEEDSAMVDYPVVIASKAEKNGFTMPKTFPRIYIIGKDGTVRGIYPTLPQGDALLKAVFG